MVVQKGGLYIPCNSMKTNTKPCPTTLSRDERAELKHTIRCCYKSKSVSDQIIYDLEKSNFELSEATKVVVGLEKMASYGAMIKSKLLSPTYLSPVDDDE